MAFLLRSRLSLACETSATTGFQSFQETRELVTVELPIEWARFAIGQFFVQPQALFHFIRAGKVIRRQHLPLDDRKVDFDLVQPTGVNRCVHHDGLPVSLSQTLDGSLSTVTGAIVHHPKHSFRRTIWFDTHHLIHQATERHDARFRFATTQNATAANIPTGQILQGAAALVLVFYPHAALRSRRQRGMTTDAGLNTGLLIRTDDKVPASQRFPLPGARIKIQNAPRLLGKGRITRKNPVPVTPWLDGVRLKNPPNGARADGSSQSVAGSRRQVGRRQAAQGQIGLADRFTGDGFDDRLIARGKKWPCSHVLLGRAARSPLAPTVVATTAPSWGEVRPPRRPRHSIGWDHHGATTPTLPAETVRAAWCVVEPAADNARRNRRETGAGRTAPDRTSCDSIRRKCAAVHAECRDRNARCTQTATLQLFVK